MLVPFHNLHNQQHLILGVFDLIISDIVIQHNSSHMGVLNSLALSKLNLTVESSCPQGGRIEIKDGELTGYLEEAAFTSYLQKVPMPLDKHNIYH